MLPCYCVVPILPPMSTCGMFFLELHVSLAIHVSCIMPWRYFLKCTELMSFIQFQISKALIWGANSGHILSSSWWGYGGLGSQCVTELLIIRWKLYIKQFQEWHMLHLHISSTVVPWARGQEGTFLTIFPCSWSDSLDGDLVLSSFLVGWYDQREVVGI